MNKKILLSLLAMFLMLSPVKSRVHIRYVGSRPQPTEAEREANDKRDVIFIVAGIIFFGAIFYYGNKNNS